MPAPRFRFGLFELDAGRLELRREGVLLRLQAQPAQVLACLMERAGQVVPREDLRKAVWGDATFVDFEAGLNFCISQIRSVLRDDSAQPLYIRTIPKSGYQFIAPVQQIAQPADTSAQTISSETLVDNSAEPAERSGNARGQEPLEPVSGSTGNRAEQPENGRGGRSKREWRWIAVAVAATTLIVVALWSWRARHVLGGQPAPILAVARFDNETGDPALDRFGDALTDDVVQELTARSGGNYRVIGNAQILRLPREQRDLRAIAASLNAGYVVLGQVQTNGEQVRILAHLIRLSDQTHIWVVRLDRSRSDDLKLEADAAAQIATQFASRMARQPEKAGSFAPRSH